MSTTEPTTSAVSVDLSIPIQADLVVLARLTAATVAGRAGFGVEDIEDLRLAVEELSLTLVQDSREGRLHLNYDCDADSISVTCWFEAPEGSPPRSRTQADDLSLRILDALVDEHGRESRSGQPGAWLRKRRATTPA